MDAVIQSRASNQNGSEPDGQTRAFSIASAQDDTTGSELGEPVIPEAQARISAWMRRDTFAPLERLGEESVMASNIRSNDSRATDVASTSATLTANDDLESDEEELEIEMAQKVLALGRQQSKRGEHAQCEAMLRRALSKSQGLSTKTIADLNTKDITYEIAIACFEQSKLDETQQICEDLINELPNDDADRARMLDTSHLLAQVHFRKAAFDPAIRQCKQTIKGRRRLDSESPAYYDSIALLVMIHEANDDEIEAMAYASLLPENYQRPTFKGPVSTVPQPTSASISPKIAGNHGSPATSPLMESTPATSDTLPTLPPMPKMGPLTSIQEAEALVTLKANKREITSETFDPSEALIWAAGEGYDLVVRLLLLQPVVEPAKKAFGIKFKSTRRRTAVSVNSVNKEKVTPLHNAARNGRLSTCRVLLQHVNQSAAIELFLDTGIDVDVKDNYSRTPLCRACVAGHMESVQVLIKRGAKVTLWFNETLRARPIALTPLHYAAWGGHASLLPILVEHGAAPNARCQGGLVPLHFCAMLGHQEAAKKLISLNANALLRTTVDTALCLPLGITPGDRLDFSMPVAAGWSILHSAAMHGREQLVAMLLDMDLGFATDECTDSNCTPLMMAALNGRLAVVELLMKRGADINFQDKDGSSASHCATSNAHWEVAELLARAGAEYCACSACNRQKRKQT